MKTVKIKHSTMQLCEQTINSCEANNVLFYWWPDTLCVVVQYQPLESFDLFNHLVIGVNPNCETQFVTEEDKEQLGLKSFAV